jgi:hypothetical protein
MPSYWRKMLIFRAVFKLSQVTCYGLEGHAHHAILAHNSVSSDDPFRWLQGVNMSG